MIITNSVWVTLNVVPAANSVMHVSADGDGGLEGTGSSVGTVGGSTGARCSSSSSSSLSFSTSSLSLSSSDGSLS
ncbi:hypothetical protein Tco_0910442 [Tanacetum coccineum]|uniref:REJ domain-containing protein n=1 Tax=Tanacetum coccineum TaxID=301880 RepID=A0ABQ5CVL9_9ASTR